MLFYPEAEPLEAGTVRLCSSQANMISPVTVLSQRSHTRLPSSHFAVPNISCAAP